MAKTKICGITNEEDALWATNLGVEFIGLNFYKDSPRKVSEKNAKEIIAKLPPFINAVGVFVDEPMESIVKIAKKCGFKYLQLHGNETPEYCSELKEKTSAKIIKVFKMSDDSVLEIMNNYLDISDYFLLDACSGDAPGGTGETFNWDLAVKVRDTINKQFFLAGGLTPDNLADAIEKVQPFGVDTASGVERLPRRKDFEKMKSFVRTAKGL